MPYVQPVCSLSQAFFGFNVEELTGFLPSRLHLNYANWMHWYYPKAGTVPTYDPATGFPLTGPSKITIEAYEGERFLQNTYTATWTGGGTPVGVPSFTVFPGDGQKNLNFNGDLAGFSLLGSGEPDDWSPSFFADAEQACAIRFMNAWLTNESYYVPGVHRWVREPFSSALAANQFIQRCLSPALIVDLANRTGVIPWINIHHKADDTEVTAIANEFLAAGLNQPLIVEFSNETWNPDFPQNAEIIAAASAYPGGATAQVAAYSFDRSDRIAEIFKSVLSTPVYGVWGCWLSVDNTFSQAMTGKTRAGDFLDAGAIGSYVGQQWATNTATETSTTSEGIAACQADWDTRVVPKTMTWKANLASIGLPCWNYEFGSSLNVQTPIAKRDNLIAISQSSQMGDFYANVMLPFWKQNLPGFHCAYRRCGANAFGMLPRELNSPGSPRWQALVAEMNC